MPTKDQTLASALHGEALLQAEHPELQPLIAALRTLTAGRDDLRVECAGIIAGAWLASPATAYGHELVAAGLLWLAGPPDPDLLEKWLRTGFERRAGSTRSYDPSNTEIPQLG